MEKKIKVNLGGGLEPNQIAQIVQIANQFSSTLYIEVDEQYKVNVKSIMGMMNFMTEDEQEVIIRTQGADEEEALAALEACLTGKE